ncbi:glycoprotein-N-acetylgalactosamine 3-beta-galactosyltransferase 1-like isoform X2 [Homarus americanus]|uniref:glycoprotein-N-acetylgalactosamine 3-beta-galactosyltransferase 1-like isoform X2 n=1 Tax=Homarus americanus TaxID=6706 RepID=UPI001C4938C0|nr:glycoprotein-N-acetylgalactosamine 3-beta-galactosyltransferase 1-like isoform X2 [Homarus americanus]
MTVRGCVKMNRSLLSPPRRSVLPFLLVATSAFVLFIFHGYTLSLPPLPIQRRATHTTRRTSDAETRGDQDREAWPRILCLIVTSPQYHEERAIHVAATWATHCTRAVFLTTANHTLLPDTLLTPGAPAYHQLWDKVTQGFLWAYKQQQEFDWVVKTDDDTFLLVENLRGALSSLDPHQSLATGALLRTADTNTTFLSGGAGYVLSRGAVVRLVEEGLKDQQCRKALKLDSREDVNMGLCLSHVEFLRSDVTTRTSLRCEASGLARCLWSTKVLLIPASQDGRPPPDGQEPLAPREFRFSS